MYHGRFAPTNATRRRILGDRHSLSRPSSDREKNWRDDPDPIALGDVLDDTENGVVDPAPIPVIKRGIRRYVAVQMMQLVKVGATGRPMPDSLDFFHPDIDEPNRLQFRCEPRWIGQGDEPLGGGGGARSGNAARSVWAMITKGPPPGGLCQVATHPWPPGRTTRAISRNPVRQSNSFKLGWTRPA